MDKLIKFYDSDTNEDIEFEIINAIEVDGQRYLLVADIYDEAAILKENETASGELVYDLVEDANEFQKVTLMFMENSSDYEIKF